MHCPQCGKTGFVTISGKRFCTNCGAKAGGSATSATPGSNLSGITGGSKTLDLRSSEPAGRPSQTAPAATQLHGGASNGAVLDLRASKPAAPPPLPVAAAPVVPAKAVEVPAAPAQAAAAAITGVTAAAPQITPPAAPPTLIKRSSSQGEPAPKSQRISKFQPPAVAEEKPAGSLPEAVVTQVDAMSTQSAQAATVTSPQSPALQQALAAAKASTRAPSILKVAAALAAVAIMSGIIWVQNSPKLAFRNAAATAGIDASLPTYVPSSYHQNGGVQVSAGRLTLNFTSPSASQPLRITQQESSWDAASLRDNYVSQQADNYLAVQGEGLTIYMFGNQANWINHGVWYQVSGTAKLSRDQIIKIAYGL